MEDGKVFGYLLMDSHFCLFCLCPILPTRASFYYKLYQVVF